MGIVPVVMGDGMNVERELSIEERALIGWATEALLGDALALLQEAVVCMEDRGIDECDFVRKAKSLLLAADAFAPEAFTLGEDFVRWATSRNVDEPPVLGAGRVDLHPATASLVDRFSVALAEKLAAAERKYGYSNEWEMTTDFDGLRTDLMQHVCKGDPLDVAAYCAFLWHAGQATWVPGQEPAASHEPCGCGPQCLDNGEGTCRYASAAPQAPVAWINPMDWRKLRGSSDGTLRYWTRMPRNGDVPLYASPGTGAAMTVPDGGGFGLLTGQELYVIELAIRELRRSADGVLDQGRHAQMLRRADELEIVRDWLTTVVAEPIPDGWQMVPVEPTARMMMKASDAAAAGDGNVPLFYPAAMGGGLQAVWRAMLKVAPEPPRVVALPREAVAVAPEPVAWMHVLDNTEGIEGNEPIVRFSEDSDEFPFGIPGEDFSESYPVISTPLYTHAAPGTRP
ncbi:hypothetical protein [Paraburkholderia sp. MM6662-R1]|uniref:hypothetical protein n=1 Tax=Paraburkholderia sp. MM6662-R1 TaxID=2991066 RepID=UPI003D1B1772